MNVTYTEHLKTRMKARKIPEDYKKLSYNNKVRKA